MKIKISKSQWEMMGRKANWARPRWEGSTGESNSDIAFNKRIDTMIAERRELSDEEFRRCSEELKKKYVSSMGNNHLTEIQLIYKRDLINAQVDLFIKDKRYLKSLDLSDHEFYFLDKDKSKKYLDELIARKLKMNRDEYMFIRRTR